MVLGLRKENASVDAALQINSSVQYYMGFLTVFIWGYLQFNNYQAVKQLKYDNKIINQIFKMLL